jgi:hypothetical protein
MVLGIVASEHRFSFRRSPLDIACAALLLTILLGTPAIFRHQLGAQYDPGLTLITNTGVAPQRRAEHVVSSPEVFMTLEPAGRFLINSDNTDVEFYLSHRAAHGFNYFWCAAVDNHYQASPSRDYYSDSPFDGLDFTRENQRYWDHVDDVLRSAATHGITIALNPGFVGLNGAGGYLASYLNSSDETLQAYGAFLGERYRDAPNLIWALGGDVDPATGVLQRVAALASGIRSEDMVHLIAAEGQPQHSALDTFGAPPWMDLNWLYLHTTNVPRGCVGQLHSFYLAAAISGRGLV